MSTSTISTVSDSVLAQMSKDAYNNPNETTPGNLSSEYTISYQTGDNGFKYAATCLVKKL